jgi:dihydroflavonol-4-reductase
MTERRPPARRPKAPASKPDVAKPDGKAHAPKPESKPESKPAPESAPAPAKRARAKSAPKTPARSAAKPRAPRSRATAVAAESPKPATARRIWLSGASGFVGRAVARLLRLRGDEVIAPVRDRRRAQELLDMGVNVIEDDLSDVASISEQLRDLDAAIHAAGSYRVGITREERGAMWDANIGTTTRLLDAAELARVPKIVYVSTVGIFGNTHGQVVDESYRRNVREGFVSWYDETKFGAQEVVAQRARSGAPVVSVLPSQVYGPGDHTAIGEQLSLAHAGKLPYRALDEVGIGWVHVDDLAVGIIAALDKGAVPGTYVLSGPRHRLREALQIAGKLSGKSLPRMSIPSGILRALAPAGRLLGQANLREVVDASAGVTYWASADKAARELGFAPRSLEDGLRDTFEAMLGRAYTR